MLSKKMDKALNDQVNAELHSAYLYLSMSAGFSARNLHGMAQWLKVQAQEEVGHAMKIYEFILDRGNKVALQPIGAVPTDWKTPLSAFSDAYAHEQKVTGMINNLVNMAIAEKDHATQVMLNWFVTEQVEEELQTSEIVQKLDLIGESAGGLLRLDHELGKREK